MSAEREAQNSSNQSIRKIAVTAHLLGQELYRLKLASLRTATRSKVLNT